MAELIDVNEAKARFSSLLKRVQMGEEIVIAKADKPIARLVPFREKPHVRKPGTAKGMISISPDFDAELPDDLLQAFGSMLSRSPRSNRRGK